MKKYTAFLFATFVFFSSLATQAERTPAARLTNDQLASYISGQIGAALNAE